MIEHDGRLPAHAFVRRRLTARVPDPAPQQWVLDVQRRRRRFRRRMRIGRRARMRRQILVDRPIPHLRASDRNPRAPPPASIPRCRERIGFSNALFPSPWHPEPDRARRLVRFSLFSEAAAVCWALTPSPKIVLRGRRLRFVPGLQVTSTDLANPRSQPTPPARGAGSPVRSRLGGLRPLQGLATGRRLRRCTRLQSQVREDLLDHRRFQDHRDDLALAAAVRAVLHVDLEHALEQLGPAQPHRTMVRTARLALRGWRGLRGRLRLLRHYLGAQLGVGVPARHENGSGVDVVEAPARLTAQCRQPGIAAAHRVVTLTLQVV